jgi:hypothetical protein
MECYWYSNGVPMAVLGRHQFTHGLRFVACEFQKETAFSNAARLSKNK